MTVDVELPGGENGQQSMGRLGSRIHEFGTLEDPGPYPFMWDRLKLATILVKVNDTLQPGTYQVSGADGYLYSNGQTVGAAPGLGTVTLTVPQQ